MEHAALIILLALVQYVYFSVRVGANRARYQVEAPKTSGNEIWERIHRVQQNTLEQLIVFIPATWFFSLYVSALWVMLPGLLFIFGRQLYSWEYVSRPPSRAPGMALTLLANAVLVGGALVGVLLKIF